MKSIENEKKKPISVKCRDAKWTYFAAAALCLAGIGVSVELTRIHVLAHTDPEFHSICALSEGVNCETVALSPFSVFAGLPVSVWGIMGYSLMGLLAILCVIGPRLNQIRPCGTLMSFSAASLVVTAFLAFISWTRIDSMCLFCTMLYGINLLLFALNAVALHRSQEGAIGVILADLRAFISRPLFAGGALVCIAIMVAATEAAIEPYWKSPGWIDLPKLNRGNDELGRHWIGAEHPKVTIVEFSDYECPHCRKAHKKMRLMAAEYPEDVRLIHRHLPLDRTCHPKIKREFHEHACKFAVAAECAAMQDMFWEMNDALFSVQDKIKASDVDVELLAVQLGLDRSAFKECIVGDKVLEKVKMDVNATIGKSLRGTPTFLVGNKKYLGQIPILELARLIEENK